MIDLRRWMILCGIAGIAGCAPLKEGSHRASQAASNVGNKIQSHAHTAEQKTRSFWNWLFGSDKDETSRPRKPHPAPTPKPAKLPTYSQQYVGESN